jgi:hypothetical protein
VTELKTIKEVQGGHHGHDELKEKPSSVTENHKNNDDDENNDDGNDKGNDDGSSGDDSITQKSQQELSTLTDDEDLIKFNAKMTTQKPEFSTQKPHHPQNNLQNPQTTPQTQPLIIEASKVYKTTKNTRNFLCRRCKIKINDKNELEIINDPTSADDDSEYQYQHHQTLHNSIIIIFLQTPANS